MIVRALMAGALALLGPELARAGIRDCTVAATTLVFGTFSGADVQASGSVILSCTGNGNGNRNNYSVALSAGQSGNYSSRQMRKGASILHYNLYQNATRTTVWGSGGPGAPALAGQLNFPLFGQAIVYLPVYGDLPPQPTPAAGHYQDQIVVTVTF